MSRLSPGIGLGQISVVRGVWASSQTHVQPFRTDRFAFTCKAAGEIQFKVGLADFCHEAQQLLTGASGKYSFKSGIFWYQRYACLTRQEGFLREARVVLQVRYQDRAGMKITIINSQFMVNQIDADGKFAFEMTE